MFDKNKGFKSSHYKPSYQLFSDGKATPTTIFRWKGYTNNYQLLKKLLPLLLLSICVGCGNSHADSKQTQVLLTPRSNLTSLTQAQTVEIRNDWNGYSDITPILRHYKLRLVSKDLVGNAHIAVGGYGASGIHQQRTTKVKIPAVVAAKFLTTLAKTPLQTGVYKPLIVRKDDYPSIAIQLKIDKKQVIFSSQSQGVDQIPWKITITENNTTTEYISNSPIPAQAFRVINSSLDRSGVDHIIYRRRVKKKK